MGCFYEYTHTHNKGLGREYMGHANSERTGNTFKSILYNSVTVVA